MIIETKGDVVRLSGSLSRNQWMTIKAAVNLLLTNHPEGIIVDCSHLENISEDGAKTFLEAMRDIEAAKSRIVVVSLPKHILSVCKTVPGVRSQLPIADSIEEARASLRMANRSAMQEKRPSSSQDGAKRSCTVLVPLVVNMDLTYGATLAARVARMGRPDVRLVYFLEVPRTLPLNAPQLEEEQAAQNMLSIAMQNAKQAGTAATEHVERVRDAAEGILAAAKTYEVDSIVFGATSEPVAGEEHERFHHLVDTLLHRAPCEVIIGRQNPSA
jgi:anti-anti-sigma regulatory factor/nucleotide-binding universal stress UspA family protein